MPNRSGIEEFFGILRYSISPRAESLFSVTQGGGASCPHPANLPSDIGRRHVTCLTALRELQRGSSRCYRLEPRHKFVGDEPRALRVRVLVALAVIVEVVAVRMKNVEVGLRTGKGDIEQSPLLFDLGLRLGGQVARSPVWPGPAPS